MLLLLQGTGTAAPPVVGDVAGDVFLDEILLYGAALDEVPIYASDNDENQPYDAKIDEVQ